MLADGIENEVVGVAVDRDFEVQPERELTFQDGIGIERSEVEIDRADVNAGLDLEIQYLVQESEIAREG